MFSFLLVIYLLSGIKEHTIKLNPKLFNALISNKPLSSLLPPKKKKQTNKVNFYITIFTIFPYTFENEDRYWKDLQVNFSKAL